MFILIDRLLHKWSWSVFLITLVVTIIGLIGSLFNPVWEKVFIVGCVLGITYSTLEWLFHLKGVATNAKRKN